MRPCIEDFLSMLTTELNIDRQDGFKVALEEGRERWRHFQSLAIARDWPEAAAEALSAVGYSVTPPDGGHPVKATAKLRRF